MCCSTARRTRSSAAAIAPAGSSTKRLLMSCHEVLLSIAARLGELARSRGGSAAVSSPLPVRTGPSRLVLAGRGVIVSVPGSVSSGLTAVLLVEQVLEECAGGGGCIASCGRCGALAGARAHT